MNNKCDICGREDKRLYRCYNHTLCSKHMHQYRKHGKFLDNNPRTNKDLNDYTIKDGLAYFNVYNQKNELVGFFFIDQEDVPKIKYHKWRFSHNRVVTGQPSKGQQKYISQIILDIKDLEGKVIDHIDGNPMNNTKSNLRLCNQKDNVINKKFMSNNTSGFIGVSYKKDRNTYDPEIRKDKIRVHLGARKELKEAVYARFVAEELIFKEFANEFEHNKKKEFTMDLPEDKKQEIKQATISKLKNKKLLWQ